MKSTMEDIVDLFDFVWQRFTDRMAGLTDNEWLWHPAQDERISLRWRLGHIGDLLSEPRNWHWLGVPAPAPDVDGPQAITGASSALESTADAFAAWRHLLSDPAVELAEPVGALAGRYGTATRRSFVLHIADELIHHTAEAALLRDLYAAKPS